MTQDKIVPNNGTKSGISNQLSTLKLVALLNHLQPFFWMIIHCRLQLYHFEVDAPSILQNNIDFPGSTALLKL
jgi:hypothetical protein